MPLSEHLSALLGTDNLPADWFHRYGVTSDRAAKFCGSTKDSNSFLNPKSETALTLFMLGRLDDWFQAKSHLPVLPRNAAGWNEQFFRAVSVDTKGWPKRSESHSPFVNWAAEISGCEREKAEDAVLLFEFEMRNTAVAKDGQLCPVSFLKVAQPWCQFDAVVILPTHRHLIFVESKLASDMSRDTSHFPFVSQAIRGWESSFLLTKCDESVIKDWRFTNILLCPRKPYEYKTAYYSYVFAEPADHVANYRSILENEYGQEVNRDWFDEFHSVIGHSVKVVHWDDLAERIESQEDWIGSYLSQLATINEMEAAQAYEAARCRFRLAGISVDDEGG